MSTDHTAIANPFPGLRPFERDEDYLFFGRDGQTDEVLRRLRRTRFVAVVGTSGSGKSSLVRAGLLPRLHGGLHGGVNSGWRVKIFRPGSNPIGNLAEALTAGGVLDGDERDRSVRRAMIEATLRRGALGLADAVRHTKLPEGENLLLVVDQFEEIFRFMNASATEHSADDAAALVKLLLEAAGQDEVPVYVVITMRSDFLGDCAQFRDLPEAINDGQYLIPRMTRDQRREAITGPVAVGGAEITPRLVNRLLNDVGDNPDQLPILQHALMRTWQQWALDERRDVPLDLLHYQAIGGMAEALSRHADKAYSELPDERSKTIAEKLFKLLTGRGDNNRESRRPTRLREICAVAKASEAEVGAVIESFRRQGRSFLMPPAGVELRADTFIDISHESLTRGWERLKHWIDDEALSARIFRRLADTAALYRTGQASLWRDPDLAIALAWRERNRPNAAWGARYSHDFDAAMEFLEESRRAQTAEIEERDREHNERDRQRRKTLRLTQALAAALLIGFLLSAGFAVYAFQQRNQALQRKGEAENSERKAKQAQLETEDAKNRAEQEKLTAQAARDEAKRSAELAQAKAQEANEASSRARAALEIARRHGQRAEEQRRLAEQEKAAAQAARDEAKRSAELAEARAAEASAARVMAEDASKQSEKSKAWAEEQQELAARNAERTARLSARLLSQGLQENAVKLDMAGRLAQTSTPSEKVYWHLIKAEAHLNLKQNDEAISEINEALKIDNDDHRARLYRSYGYLLLGDPEKAVGDARRSIEKSPSNAAAYQNLVLALASLGNYREAEESLNRIIGRFMHTGTTFSETEIASEIAQETKQRILVAESDEALTALHYERATVASASGSNFEDLLKEADKRPQSVDAYLFALNWAWLHQRLNKNDYGVLVAQGALWARAGFPERAKRTYAEFLKIHEEKRDPRYENLARWVRQPGAASPLAPDAASEKQREGRALALEATLLLVSSDLPSEGLPGKSPSLLFDRAAEASPQNIDILLGRAMFLFSRSQFQLARRQFDVILQLAPHNAIARLYRGLSGFQTESRLPNEEVLKDIREARELDPTVVPDSVLFGQKGEDIALLIAQSNPDEALDFLERVAKYNQPTPEPYYFMAKLLNKLGKYERALEKIQIAIEMRGTEPKYYEQRTLAEEGLGVARPARGAARSSTERAGDAATRRKALEYVELGDSMLKFGDPDKALDAYGESLRQLNAIASPRGFESVRCEVETVLGKVKKIAEARWTKEEAAEYMRAMFGDMSGIEQAVKKELIRLPSRP